MCDSIEHVGRGEGFRLAGRDRFSSLNYQEGETARRAGIEIVVAIIRLVFEVEAAGSVLKSKAGDESARILP